MGKVISVDGQTYECVEISIPENIAKEGYKYKYSYTSRYLNDEKNIYNRGSFYVKEPITVEFINSIEGEFDKESVSVKNAHALMQVIMKANLNFKSNQIQNSISNNLQIINNVRPH